MMSEKASVVFFMKQTEERQELLKHSFANTSFYFPDKKGVPSDQILKTADVLVTFGDDITESLVSKAPSLKWIHVMSAGIEGLPLRLLHDRGVLVTNSRGIHAEPMSEHAIWAMLDYVKNATRYRALQQNKQWDKSIKPKELTGMTAVFLGTGAIASKTAERANMFGMRTIGVNTDGRPQKHFEQTFSMEEWHKALRKADVLINILPYTEQTHGILNKEAFKQLKGRTVFINLGRGKSVVETDLLDALKLKQIEHAYLDVFAEEPLPIDSPLWDDRAVTMTPHVSAATSHYMKRALVIFMENLKAFINNEDLKNVVCFEKGY